MKEKIYSFEYRGIKSEDYSCYYIPSHSDLMKTTPDFTVSDINVTGRDGGYYYGNNLKPRDFNLKIYFEEITLKQKSEIYSWFDRNTEGKLIFNDRPFVSYHVRPVSSVTGEVYLDSGCVGGESVYSGTFNITLRAYDPFGYLDRNFYVGEDMEGIGNYCGILEQDEMPKIPTLVSSGMNFLVYNCGTQPTDTVIQVSGAAPKGLVIKNNINGDMCTINSIPSGSVLEIDSYYGTVKSIKSGQSKFDFEAHDEGYICLESCGDLYTNISVTTSARHSTAQINGRVLNKSVEGRYMYINNEWLKIIRYLAEENKIVLGKPADVSSTFVCKIATMNEISIEGENLNLASFDMKYIPRIY